jgi:anaerobic selenocysteine-containing dehydrogenase
MDRRNFFKLVGTASGGAITGACGKQGQVLIPLLVPEESIVPGTESWHPSVCGQCSAGCGTILRVMEAEREIEIHGEKVRERIAAVKKIEGNPLDPVSGGRLCARGQAAVQGLYHPDRVRGPLQCNSGQKGDFEDVTWAAALSEVAQVLSRAIQRNPASVVYLTGPGTGTRAVVVKRFLEAIGADAATTIGLGDFTVERRAAKILYGRSSLPGYEIQNATRILGIGADFLGGWVSPVLYARQFGHFRRGRPGIRGKLIHAESRFSQTAWSADRWLPVAPGGEHALALGIGYLLTQNGLGKNNAVAKVHDFFHAVDFPRAVKESGLNEDQLKAAAEHLATAEVPLVVPGASIVQPNSVDAVLTAGALNVLLGNAGDSGGVHISSGIDTFEAARPQFANLAERLASAEIIILDRVNPVHSFPGADVLLQNKIVISFASVLDDSAHCANFVLPDHDSLETGALVVPAVSSQTAINGSRAFVKPLYNTRATEEVLVELAAKLDRKIMGYSSVEAFRDFFQTQNLISDDITEEEFVSLAERSGGSWKELSTEAVREDPSFLPDLRSTKKTELDSKYPYRFQVYPSVQFGFGSDSHLPWLQQLPDPTSSSMWGLPLEIDPVLAKRLRVVNGDAVRVTSTSGSIEAIIYIHPAALPGVVSMAAGQGHTEFGRYASGKGANPLLLLDASREARTGVPALGATFVMVEKLDRHPGLLQFTNSDREVSHERM